MANGIGPREAHGHRPVQLVFATSSHLRGKDVDGLRRLLVVVVESRQITKSVNEPGDREGPPLEPVHGS
jgi:hypothetical protein